MQHSNFGHSLTALMDQSAAMANRDRADIRPFVCDGSPLDCDVFIIGTNAASTVEWSSYWDSQNAVFDKAGWFESYKNQRMAKKIAEGKHRAQPVSGTRKRIDLIVEAMSNRRVLETNVYSVSTPKEADMKIQDHRSEIFEFLMEMIKPKALLVHGSKATAFLKARYGLTPTANGEIGPVSLPHGVIPALFISHLMARDGSVTNLKVVAWAKQLSGR